MTLAPINVATPINSGHATTKSYVDNATTALSTALGITSGTYSPNLAAHYISSATSAIVATNDLDTALYIAVTNSGLNSSGVYAANPSAHYINTAVSIVDSTNKLDTAIFNNNSTIKLIETSVGLSSLGSYSAPSSNYLGSTTSVLTALTALDSQIYTINGLNLGNRVSSLETFETATTNIDTQQNQYIQNINTSSGFPSNGVKGGYSSTNFILNTDSLMGAIAKLDTEAQVISSSISSINATVTTLNSSIGSPGTYSKVVTDSLGRVTSGSNLSTSDITTALGYTPANNVSVREMSITTTNVTNVITVTPSVISNILVNVFYRIIGSPSNVTINVGYVDGAGVSQTQVMVAATNQAVGNYIVTPVFVASSANNLVTLSILASAANQVYISATMQQF
jgi:hypothetical protein